MPRSRPAPRQQPPSHGSPAAAAVPTCWQVASGSGQRSYPEQFLRYGMAFVGGRPNIEAMARVRAGDRLILKRGRTAVLAVGEVVERDGRAGGCGDKVWLRDFDGWDLPAYCHVRWHRPPEPIPAEGLTRTSLHAVHINSLRDLAERVLREHPPAGPPEPEPAPTPEIGDEQLLDFLIARGLRAGAAEELADALARVRRLARFYREQCDWEDVREHETRTFLVLPLLLGMGWPEQRIKIELTAGGGRIDVALFSRPYRRGRGGNAEDACGCVTILEAKGFPQGLGAAPEQARGYARHFPSCRTLVVSNGYVYKAFRRGDDGLFSDRPSAYLNVLRPTAAYPLDPAATPGALALLEQLLPGGG